MNYEVLEHTADIGIRAWGSSFAEMIAHASEALVSIVMEPEDIAPREAYPIAASGEDRESLLVNWLNEVVYYLDGRMVGLRRFDVKRASETEATGIAWGELRTSSHAAKLIVKGVTYHQLRVAEEGGHWCCEVYLDI